MELDKLINMLIKEKGGTRRQYHLLMDKISNHESKGKIDVAQIGGGPGRGLFQFEIGNNKGAKTAANRLTTYLKAKSKPIPTWLSDINKNKSVDASKLNAAQQKMLFLGNMREHPKANFSKVWDGKESVTDFWQKYHWEGDKKDKIKRRNSFENSLKEFKEPTYDFENVAPPVPYWKKFLPEQSPLPQPVAEVPSTAPNNQGYGLNLDQFDLGANRMVNQTPEQSEDPNQLTNKRLSAEEMGFMQNSNVAAMGGYTEGGESEDGKFNSFNNGGTHEANPHGGIPLGTGSNGKMNTVEEGETSFEFKEGKFIFSNRIKI